MRVQIPHPLYFVIAVQYETEVLLDWATLQSIQYMTYCFGSFDCRWLGVRVTLTGDMMGCTKAVYLMLI